MHILYSHTAYLLSLNNIVVTKYIFTENPITLIRNYGRLRLGLR